MEKYLPVTESEEMVEHARLAVERHKILRAMPEEGQEEGGNETLWRVEDQMMVLWQSLDEAQRQAINGLASDLAWVRRGGTLAPKSHSAAELLPKHVFMLTEALKSDSWYKALYYVRVCLPMIGNHLAGIMRASLYQNAFHGIASKVFSAHFHDVYPQMPHPRWPNSPEEWAEWLEWPPERIWRRHRWFEFWETAIHNGWPFGEELQMMPTSGSLGDRLAHLMLSTLPWPISPAYLSVIAGQVRAAPDAINMPTATD